MAKRTLLDTAGEKHAFTVFLFLSPVHTPYFFAFFITNFVVPSLAGALGHA
jgi:hypothetical protein